MTNSLDEEEIISVLWNKIGRHSIHDPFDDDAAWVSNSPKKLVVIKSDMLVASTDAPEQMTFAQMARKSIISCVSDFAAKGVKPSFCLISIGLPKGMNGQEVVNDFASGFSSAEKEYAINVLGGDTNSTATDIVIDCTLIGFANEIVKRRGATAGHLVGVTGTFGHQKSGLLLLQGKASTNDCRFEKRAVDSVLTPRARLGVGLKASKLLSSCIDSSDGLAISLYHIAESSGVNIDLQTIPSTVGLDDFAFRNKIRADELALFGGEEFELVCTYDARYKEVLARIGIRAIGSVKSIGKGSHPRVFYEGNVLRRDGWTHFKSQIS